MDQHSAPSDVYSSQLLAASAPPPLPSAGSPSATGHLDKSKYSAMSLFNNNVMAYGHGVARKYGDYSPATSSAYSVYAPSPYGDPLSAAFSSPSASSSDMWVHAAAAAAVGAPDPAALAMPSYYAHHPAFLQHHHAPRDFRDVAGQQVIQSRFSINIIIFCEYVPL
jgi:hypothetical protein